MCLTHTAPRQAEIERRAEELKERRKREEDVRGLPRSPLQMRSKCPVATLCRLAKQRWPFDMSTPG